MAAAGNGNATSLPGKPQKDPGRCERPYAGGCDHLLEARVQDRVAINSQQTLSKERTITNISDRKADAAARQSGSFEFSPQILWIISARWQMGMPSCPRRGKRTPPAFWPSTRPYGGGICSHQHAAQVHDGAVIKFPKIPSKEEIIISVNEPQADAAARRSWCPVQRKKNCTPRRKKKKLHNWVSHQAAGRCRLPQRHHSWPPTTSNE